MYLAFQQQQLLTNAEITTPQLVRHLQMLIESSRTRNLDSGLVLSVCRRLVEQKPSFVCTQAQKFVTRSLQDTRGFFLDLLAIFNNARGGTPTPSSTPTTVLGGPTPTSANESNDLVKRMRRQLFKVLARLTTFEELTEFRTGLNAMRSAEGKTTHRSSLSGRPKGGSTTTLCLGIPKLKQLGVLAKSVAGRGGNVPRVCVPWNFPVWQQFLDTSLIQLSKELAQAERVRDMIVIFARHAVDWSRDEILQVIEMIPVLLSVAEDEALLPRWLGDMVLPLLSMSRGKESSHEDHQHPPVVGGPPTPASGRGAAAPEGGRNGKGGPLLAGGNNQRGPKNPLVAVSKKAAASSDNDDRVRGRIVSWLCERAAALESRVSADAALNLLQTMLTQTSGVTPEGVFPEAIVKRAQLWCGVDLLGGGTRGQWLRATTDKEEKLLGVFRDLREIIYLRDQHNFEIDLADLQTIRQEEVVCRLLRRVGASSLLQDEIQFHILPYCKRHELSLDSALDFYIGELLEDGREILLEIHFERISDIFLERIRNWLHVGTNVQDETYSTTARRKIKIPKTTILFRCSQVLMCISAASTGVARILIVGWSAASRSSKRWKGRWPRRMVC